MAIAKVVTEGGGRGRTEVGVCVVFIAGDSVVSPSLRSSYDLTLPFPLVGEYDMK